MDTCPRRERLRVMAWTSGRARLQSLSQGFEVERGGSPGLRRHHRFEEPVAQRQLHLRGPAKVSRRLAGTEVIARDDDLDPDLDAFPIATLHAERSVGCE